MLGLNPATKNAILPVRRSVGRAWENVSRCGAGDAGAPAGFGVASVARLADAAGVRVHEGIGTRKAEAAPSNDGPRLRVPGAGSLKREMVARR